MYKIQYELSPFDNVKIESVANKDVDNAKTNKLIMIPKTMGFFLLCRSIFVPNLKAVRQRLFELSCHNKLVYGQNWMDGWTDRRTNEVIHAGA